MAVRSLFAALVVMVVTPAGTWAYSPLRDSLSHPDTHHPLQVFHEVVTGPLTGHPLVLYLDPDLGPHTLARILTLPALQYSSLVLVDLSSDGQGWCQKQPLAILRGENLVHIAVFASDPRPFFRAVVGTNKLWRAKYLVLFSLSKELTGNILKDHEFSRAERIVMFTQHINDKIDSSAQMYMVTYFPFAHYNRIVSLGPWSGDGELLATDIFVDRFPTFEGYKFLLGTWLDDFPFLHQARDRPEGEGVGSAVEMLDAMATRLNFSYNFTYMPPDEKWGDFEDGAWTGILKMVHDEYRNFSVNNFGYTPKRFEDFDSSVPYWVDGFGMALIRPQPLPKWRNVYYPFSPVVWAAIALCVSVVIVAFYLQDLAQVKPLLGGLGEVWLYVLSPALSRTLPTLPDTYSQRVFLAAWCLVCLILTTAYTANLIAFLTIPLYPKQLETVEQLAESDFRASMLDYGEFVPQALRSSQDTYYRALAAKLDLYAKEAESVYPVLNGTHAYIQAYYYSRILFSEVYQARNIYMLREQLYPNHLCWYFQKNTAWKYKFDIELQYLLQTGLVAHWVKVKTEYYLGNDFERKWHLESTERPPAVALTLEHTQGLFFLLLLGWGLSGATFLWEAGTRTHTCADTALRGRKMA